MKPDHIALLRDMASRPHGHHLVSRSRIDEVERDVQPLLDEDYITRISPLSQYAPGFRITSKGLAFIND